MQLLRTTPVSGLASLREYTVTLLAPAVLVSALVLLLGLQERANSPLTSFAGRLNVERCFRGERVKTHAR